MFAYQHVLPPNRGNRANFIHKPTWTFTNMGSSTEKIDGRDVQAVSLQNID